MGIKTGIVWFSVLAMVLLNVLNGANGQGSMDPKVNITETDPPSDGHIVHGLIALDVVLTCYVENLVEGLDVRWQKTWVDSSGTERYQLISINMGVVDNMKYSIEKPTTFSWRLRIKALELPDEGNYKCFVDLTGSNNLAESNRTVLAYDPPLILEGFSSNDQKPVEGDYVPLRCNASGRPYPTIMWRREGNNILPSGGTRWMGPELNIESIPYDGNGRYICETFNIVGYDRRDIFLDVQHSPKCNPDQESVGQAVGYQRTLVCHIESRPQPSLDPEHNQLSWIKGSQKVMPDDRIIHRVIEGAYGRLTYEMVIRWVEPDDYDDYRCQARNNLGTGEAQVELYETDEPQPDKRGVISGVTSLFVSIATLLTCSLTFLLH